MTWPEVVAAAERHAWNGQPVSRVTDDSRAVTLGTVFVARRGFVSDGHAFVGDAVRRGAVLVVCEDEVRCEVPVCRVASGRQALSGLAAAWYGHPSRGLCVVGVTGTNGKTTAVSLIASILRAAGLDACTIGTLGFAAHGRPRRDLGWTTPPPTVLQGLLAEARARGMRAAVLEVSAQAVSQSRVADCAFDVGALTNISREHGEYFGNPVAYRRAKLAFFGSLGDGGKPARAVLNAALPWADEFRRACSVPRLEYGEGGEVQAQGVRSRHLRGSDFWLGLPGSRAGGPFPVRLRLPGRYNVDNALCAAAVCHALDVEPATIVAGLERVREVPGRLQTVQRQPFRVVVDYAHNPAGLRALLSLLRAATPGRLTLVMGARGRRERGKRSLMGAVAAAFCDAVILTSDRPAGEDPEEAAAPMGDAVADVGVPVRFEPDRFEALRRAVAAAARGDCVVVAGKGEEPWRGDSVHEPLNDPGALSLLLARSQTGIPVSSAD